MPLDSYRYQTTNNFEKFSKQESVENTTIIATPIILVIRIHIEPTRLLEDGTSNVNHDLEEKLCGGCTGLD